MQNVMGMVNTDQKGEVMKSLTNIRSLSSVPFGSRYRLIDFCLSNMVTAGITNIGILLEKKYRSLLDHIGPGKAWDLDRKRGGLYFLPPAKVYEEDTIFKGNIENFYHNLDYLHKCNQEYVIIASPHVVCNIDYEKVYKFHIKKKADITVVYQQVPTENKEKYTFLETGKNKKVIDMRDKSRNNSYNKIAMHNFLMKKDLLAEIIDDCASKGKWDFLKDGIIGNLDKYKIIGYPYKGFLGIINSINNYFKINLQLLNPQIRKNLFFDNTVYTKSKDESPSRIAGGGTVKNSLFANGCLIKGNVENSVFFREVKVEERAFIKNSIILQNASIGKGAYLENVILDKNTRITRGKEIIGDENRPTILEKNTVV